MFRKMSGQLMANKVRSLILANQRSITSTVDKSSTSLDNETPSPPTDENQHTLDAFTKEFLSNQIKLTPFQKTILSAGSSITALLDPHRHDMIACLGETTGDEALRNILEQMKDNTEGQQILADKPRINTKTVNMKRLRSMPINSFGYTYVKFLDDNNVTPDSRMAVKFLDDPELAYVMTRYRECHDLLHAVLGMPTNMLGEVAVKWVEAINTKLPMCYGGAIFGAARLRPKQRRDYKKKYLPWAIANGKSVKPLLPVYWERRWEQDVNDLRNELGIHVLN